MVMMSVTRADVKPEERQADAHRGAAIVVVAIIRAVTVVARSVVSSMTVVPMMSVMAMRAMVPTVHALCLGCGFSRR